MRIIIIMLLLSCQISMFGQSINFSFAEFNLVHKENSFETHLQMKCHIENNRSSDLVLFFTENVIDTVNVKQSIVQKVCRKYQDFSLSMLAWEPNMIISPGLINAPNLFVKILSPLESFEIFVDSDSNDKENLCHFILQHLLICKEEDLAAVGLSHFTEGVKQFGFEYQKSFIIFNYVDLLRYVAK